MIATKAKLLLIDIISLAVFVICVSTINAHTISDVPQEKKSKQEKSLPPLAYSADVKIGPFRIEPFISIKNMGYDSNILYSATEATADYTATPSAGLKSIVLLGRKGYLSLDGELGYLWFYQTKSQNFLNKYANAHLEASLSRFSLYAEEAFADVRDRYGNEIDFRTTHTTNSATVGLLYEPSRKTSLEVSLSQALLKYDSEATFREYNLSEILNHQRIIGTVTFGYQMLPKTKGNIELKYGEYNFENPASELNSLSYEVLAGAEFDPSAFIQGTFKLGYKNLVFSSPDIKDFSGLTGSASLKYRFSEHLSFLFNYDRNAYYSYFARYYISDLYGGTIAFYLTSKIGIDLGSTYTALGYPLREIENSEQLLNRVYRHNVSIKYKLTEDISVGMAGVYWIRRSSEDATLQGFNVFSIVSYEF
jgi:hypothetical protein